MKKEIHHPFIIQALRSTYEFRWNASFRFAGERHDFWEIVCVLDGTVEAVEDEKVYVLSAGEMICHAPLEFHSIRSYGNTEPHVLVLSFLHSGALPKKLEEGLFLLSSDELAEYQAIFHRAKKWFHGSAESDPLLGAECSAALTSFLLRLCTTHDPHNTQSHSRQAKEYRRIVEIMQNAACENLSLSEIASRATVSASTVKALFSVFSSISPIKYYSQLQIEEAKRLLSKGLSIAEIADRMHFSSPNYFSVFFKRHLGTSPGKYVHTVK